MSTRIEGGDLLDDFEVFCAISRHGSLHERHNSDVPYRRRQGSYGEDRLRYRNIRRGSGEKPERQVDRSTERADRMTRNSPTTRMDPDGTDSPRRGSSEKEKLLKKGVNSPTEEKKIRRPSNFSDVRRCQRTERMLCHMTQINTDEDWDIGSMRPRVSSMPARMLHRKINSRAPSLVRLRANNSPDIHRVRAFTITAKGVVSNGDKYVSNSNVSVASNESEAASLTPEGSQGTPTPSLSVVVFGDHGVGKNALIQKFLSTGDSCASSIDDEAEKSVSILLDGEESTMEFIDVADEEMDRYLSSNQADAYVVVYSVEDRASFEGAIDRLYEIRKDDQRNIAVILVANKADLVRSRVVLEEEGRSAAKTYDSKYIEVSAAIEHKVNDLLVGILKQIRLIKAKTEKSHARYGRHRVKLDADSCCLIKARQNVLGKLLRTKFSSKSCDNLYVL